MTEPIHLVDLREDNWERVAALEVAPGQEGFVAPSLRTIAETQFNLTAVRRVIMRGDEPIGLAAYAVDPDDNQMWLWRFMIAGSEQGKGYGTAALRQLIGEWRTIPGLTQIIVGYKPENELAERLYVRMGFVPGDLAPWGERTALLDLAAASGEN